MKLLFDQNLSPSLVRRLSDLFSLACHVSTVGLGAASDEVVWEYAWMNAYTIVTKDADFSDFGVMRGFPPQIIWLRLGNCTTHAVEIALRAQNSAIMSLDADPTIGVLTIV
ncbi:MAG: DUF5615 family PIN-like protein [Thermomicrobia bacterium]|nr:DUF5615 family PIN-like protein [Thermomicrobia bacterium]